MIDGNNRETVSNEFSALTKEKEIEDEKNWEYDDELRKMQMNEEGLRIVKKSNESIDWIVVSCSLCLEWRRK